MSTTDNGPQPNTFDIETATKDNTAYRAVAWTGKYLQVTLMSIPVGSSIGLEVHPETDQFLRIDAGRGVCRMGPSENDLTDTEVSDGWSIQVPAGTWHDVVNTGDEPLQALCGLRALAPRPGQGAPDGRGRREGRGGRHRRASGVDRPAGLTRPAAPPHQEAQISSERRCSANRSRRTAMSHSQAIASPRSAAARAASTSPAVASAIARKQSTGPCRLAVPATAIRPDHGASRCATCRARSASSTAVAAIAMRARSIDSLQSSVGRPVRLSRRDAVPVAGHGSEVEPAASG